MESGNYTMELKFDSLRLVVEYYFQANEPDTDTQSYVEVNNAWVKAPGNVLLEAGDMLAELGAWEPLQLRVWAELHKDSND